jgi:hypothetical protein
MFSETLVIIWCHIPECHNPNVTFTLNPQTQYLVSSSKHLHKINTKSLYKSYSPVNLLTAG